MIPEKGKVPQSFRVVLSGNPNSGKSTVFNAMTGLNRHTGNWAGKTVENASAFYSFEGDNYEIIDIPGIYSLEAFSKDEQEAVDLLKNSSYDVLVIVADATCLERALLLCISELELCSNAVVCLNLSDEAKKRNIDIDHKKLAGLLQAPVVPTSARSKAGIRELKAEIAGQAALSRKLRVCSFSKCRFEGEPDNATLARTIAEETVSCKSEDCFKRDRKIDNIVLTKKYGVPLMLLMIFAVFWLTIVGANYPSELLRSMFSEIEAALVSLFEAVNINETLKSAVIYGMFRTSGNVVSVMLPPMAIFSPLFNLLEDSGLLPRIAFNTDGLFNSAGTNGKNALTMCMGFGCSACGVTSCRIMGGGNDRKISVLTNSLVPCNGKYPSLILLSGFILGSGEKNSFLSALVVFLFVLAAIGVTFVATKLLSVLFGGKRSSAFVLELPPYRRPQFLKTVLLSLKDNTLKILGRAVIVAAPGGLVLWLLQNTDVNGVSALSAMSSALDPAGRFLGMDGVIIAAFILGWPANEIVVPIMLTCYPGFSAIGNSGTAQDIYSVFTANGWTAVTAVCTMLFFLFHFPCATTVLTIKKELSSLKLTILAFILPTSIGIALCCAVSALFRLTALF